MNRHREIAGMMRAPSGVAPSDRFIFEVDTTAVDETFTIPCQNAGVFNATVYWGDGGESTITTYNDANLVHTYAAAGTHSIEIDGTFPNIYFNNVGDKLKIKDITNWGNTGFLTMLRAFYGCINLTVSATDDGFSEVTNMSYMFDGATAVNPYTSNWNTSAVTDMSYMFSGAAAANIDVSGWDVGNVTSMINLFFRITSSVLDVSLWDVSKVESIRNMFYDGIASPDVSLWVTTSLKDASNAFRNCTNADPDISGWDVSVITTMSSIFQGSTFGDVNYDAALLAWSALPSVQAAVPFHAGTAKYTETAARAVLTDSPNNWVITDGGPA